MKIYTNEMIKNKKDRSLKVRKVLKIICKVILAIVLLLCLIIGYKKIVLQEPNVELFGYQMYVVLTGSMKPDINPNDIVVIKKVNQDDLKEGDIITFNIGGKSSTVTHRIIEIVKQDDKVLYRTKGDNNNTQDADLVKYEDIQGIFIFKISKIGTILTGGLTGTGLILIFLFLAISYHHSSKMEDRMLTREEARKRYNVYKYKDKEDANE